jgi:hypothetical protein
MKILGYTLGIIAGLAYVAFAIWRMFIIGAFIAFFRLTFGNK